MTADQTPELVMALPKGRILEEALPLLELAGILPDGDFAQEESRQLRFATNQPGLSLVQVRSFDVATFVAFNAAQLGIVGSDVLMEFDYPELYAPVDLGIGRCRLSVAEPEHIEYRGARVAALVCVAGWLSIDEPWDTIEPWIETPLDFARVRRATGRTLVLVGDDDPFTRDYEATGRAFQEHLGADVVVAHGGGHFNRVVEPAVDDLVAAVSTVAAIVEAEGRRVTRQRRLIGGIERLREEVIEEAGRIADA